MKEILSDWKYITVVVVAVLMLFSVRGCYSRQADILTGENKVLKEQVGVLKDGVAVAEVDRIRQKDSIRLEGIKKQKIIDDLLKKAKDSEERVVILEREASKKRGIIKNMSYVAIADTLNYIYGGKNATATSNSVDIKDKLPNQILQTVSDANFAQHIIKEKDFQILSKNKVIKEKSAQLFDTNSLLNKTESSLSAVKELSELQTTLNKNLEKDNSKLKTKSFLNRILIPVVGVLGVIVGTQVSN